MWDKDLIKEVIIAVGTILILLVKMWLDKRDAKKATEKIATELREKDKREILERAKHTEKSGVEFNEELNRRVTHEAKKIRDRHQAMRVYVIHFSNGTVTEANLSLLKVSFMHEVVVDWLDYRVESIAKNYKETHMPEMFRSAIHRVVYGTGEYYLKDRESLNLNDVNCKDYYHWLKAYKVQSTMWLSLRNKRGRIVAVLVSDWPVATDLDGTIIAKIKDILRSIEGIYNEKLWDE